MARNPWGDGRAAWDRLSDRPRCGDDALEALSDVGLVRRLLDQAELAAVRQARRDRKSWAEISTRLGVTRQSAWERWRELDEEPAAAATGPQPGETSVGGPATVTVPDVVGMSAPAAQRRLREQRLQAVSADPDLPRLLGTDVADFEVIDQKPSAGERVAPHSPVTLWLRRGPGSAGVRAPLEPPPEPRARYGAVDEESGESVR